MSEIAEAAPEVVVTLDEAAARKLDGHIRRMGETFLRNWETLAGLVEEAKAGRIDEALDSPRGLRRCRLGAPRGTWLHVIAPQLQPCVLDP